MCDMQKMPTTDDASCDEDSEMNFAAFSTANAAGTHYVTTTGQLPVTHKLQQNVSSNGSTLQQVVSMVGDGSVQYVRALDGSLQPAPQLITLPITLAGAKPGDPQQTVQIQVLTPNMLQQQQPKYQMQIPIQGYQQGGAVLTVAYSPEGGDAAPIQVLQNTLPDGLQVLAALPQEMQLLQQQQQLQDSKEHIQHQLFITPNQQIVINGPDDTKLNNNTSLANNNAGVTNIVIKEECDDNNDEESSQGTESSENMQWSITNSQQDLIKYFNQFQPQQQQQTLPVSLQQFLRINPADGKKGHTVEIEVLPLTDKNVEPAPEPMDEGSFVVEDGSIRIQPKKKKKYKKKAPKPARPKPGQVVIASAADGTPIFCCPQCQMAYPEKEQLEMHLSVHEIERRFICGICGAGLKRKEHLERHKLGHNPERPYVCGVCRKGFKRREHLNLHTVIHSGVKTEVCPECGKGFYRKDHLRKHTRSHESKRARDEAAASPPSTHSTPTHSTHNTHNTSTHNTHTHARTSTPSPSPAAVPVAHNLNTIMPEITIHVPTSGDMATPVQINIPQHLVTSLQAQAHAAGDHGAAHQLDALLAHHD